MKVEMNVTLWEARENERGLSVRYQEQQTRYYLVDALGNKSYYGVGADGRRVYYTKDTPGAQPEYQTQNSGWASVRGEAIAAVRALDFSQERKPFVKAEGRMTGIGRQLEDGSYSNAGYMTITKVTPYAAPAVATAPVAPVAAVPVAAPVAAMPVAAPTVVPTPAPAPSFMAVPDGIEDEMPFN